MEKVVAVEVGGERIDDGEGGERAVDHGDGYGAVERDDRRGLEAFEKFVQLEDAGPAGIFGAGGLAMQRGDGGLDGEGAGGGAKGFGCEGQGLGDLAMVPAGAILVVEKDEVAGLVETGVAARVVQEHEGQQGGDFGRRGREPRPHEASETDGFGAEVRSDEWAFGGGVPFVEDEIDHRQDGVEARGEFAWGGDGVGDAGIANFALGADEALGHGGGWNEKRAGDLVGFEATERAEGEGYLGIGSEGGVAAGEDEAKTVVGEIGGVEVRFAGGLGGFGGGGV